MLLIIKDSISKIYEFGLQKEIPSENWPDVRQLAVMLPDGTFKHTEKMGDLNIFEKILALKMRVDDALRTNFEKTLYNEKNIVFLYDSSVPESDSLALEFAETVKQEFLEKMKCVIKNKSLENLLTLADCYRWNALSVVHTILSSTILP